MNVLEEIGGGYLTGVIDAGAFDQTANNLALIGFVNGDTAQDVTSIVYNDDVDRSAFDSFYLGCIENHFYKFPSKVKTCTFAAKVTGIFEKI